MKLKYIGMLFVSCYDLQLLSSKLNEKEVTHFTADGRGPLVVRAGPDYPMCHLCHGMGPPPSGPQRPASYLLI